MVYVICMLLVVGILVSTRQARAEGISRLKEMHLETELVADGKANCLIAVPDGPEYGRLGQKLAVGIGEAYGAAPPVVRASQMGDEEMKSNNLISLGIFCHNRVSEALYLREFILCDYDFPGGRDSYVIRTVHNPWLTGKNVVFIGSTEVETCGKAVDRFIDMLDEAPGGVIGPIIDVVRAGRRPAWLGEAEEASAAKDIEEESRQGPVYAKVAEFCNGAFITGDPARARLFLKALRRMDALHKTQTEFATPAECQHIYHWYDCIEECTAFSDEDRKEATELLYRFTGRLPFAQEPIEPLKSSAGNRALATTHAAFYWTRYYPELELGKMILANMDGFFAPDMVAWKPPEDCAYYSQLTVQRSYRWGFHRPDSRYIENGLLRQVADYYMLVTNNLGMMAGFGDFAGLERAPYLMEVYPLAAWLHKDGRYLWWWDHFAEEPTRPARSFYRHRGQGLMGWVPPEVLPRSRPDDLLGITRAPLDRWIYDRRTAAEGPGSVPEETHGFPIEACYDKVSFRAGFDRSDSYLCMSGVGGGYHSHPDANAIVNFADKGRTLLYDDGYMVAQPSEHNTIIVLKDGWAEGIPALSQVTAEADFDDVGLFVSRLNGYNGVTWDRCVIWPKSRYFLVVDDLMANENGSYAFQCIWRALGKADLDGRRWVSENPPARLNLIACSDAALLQKPSGGTNINSPPFPTDEARRLLEVRSLDLERGESYHFANLLYATPDTGEAQRVEACRLDETTAYLVRDDGQMGLAGVNGCDAVPDLSLEADVFHLHDATLTVAGCRGFDVQGAVLSAEDPVNVQVHLGSGEALIAAKEATRITYASPEQAEVAQELSAGRHDIRLRPVPDEVLERIDRWLGKAFDRSIAAPPGDGQPGAEPAGGITRLWEYGAVDAFHEGFQFSGLCVADGDGTGEPQVFAAGTDGAIHAVDAAGNRLWKVEKSGAIHALDLAAGRDGKHRLLAGCEDTKVYCLGTDGTEAWSFVLPPRSYARPGYHEGDPVLHQGEPVVVFASEGDRDDDFEVVIGSNQGHVYVYDAQGTPVWDRVSWTPHSMSCGTAFDIDGDGKVEIVMGSVYSVAQIFSSTGEVVGTAGGSSHAGATAIACGDIDGDGKGEIVAGDRLGKLWLQAQGSEGDWSLRVNTRAYDAGSDLTAVAMADVDGDGKLETAAASKNFMLYLIGADREPRWHLNLGDVCLDIDIADVTGDGRAEVVCACEDGTVRVVSAEGDIIAQYQAGGVVRRVRACSLEDGREAKDIIAACDDGKIVALRVDR